VTKKELKLQQETKFGYTPKISIVVAAFNTPLAYLAEMIDAVRDQSYGNWELCISDGSTNSFVEDYVAQNYGNDPRIKYTKLDKNYGISGNMNAAMDLATGDFIALYDHDDLITPDCLFEIVQSMQETRHDVVYTDEDKLNDATKGFMDPHFKSDFNLEQLCSHNYITHFFVVSREIVDKIGKLDSSMDGSQDHDFILRACEQAQSIHHIPKILYHWRMHPASTAMNPESKLYCYEAGKRAVQAHLDRCHIDAQCELMPRP
jgi:glycosyltransferase involved in cell wall biosynthesis